MSQNDTRGDDESTSEQDPLSGSPGALDLAALQTVEEAAAQHWQSLPDKPDMAVPVNREGVNAVRGALDASRVGAALHPEVSERLDTFETVLQWATSSRFSGSLASPLGAGLVAVLLIAVSLDEARLPGTQSRLMLFAGALVLQALLFPSFARQPQFELNAHFLAGTKNRDERFVRWLLTKGALIYTPMAALRALVYGALIPLSTAKHMMRRGQFAAAAALLGLNLAVFVVAMNIPVGVPKVPDSFEVGIDVLGHWVPYSAPLTSIPEDATRLQDYGWQLQRRDEDGGVEASVYTREGHLGIAQVKAWAPVLVSDSNRHLSLYQRSAENLESVWGAPTRSRSEPNDNGTCLTRWITYLRAGMQLEIKELHCTTSELRSLSRRISASVEDD